MSQPRQIEVRYCCKSGANHELDYTSSSKLFRDWWDFADWLKQQTINDGPVLITSWTYVEA